MKAAEESKLKTPLAPSVMSPGGSELKVKTGPNSMMMLNYSDFTVIECPHELKGVAFALSFSFQGKAGADPIPIEVEFPKGKQSGLYKKQGDTYVAIVSKELGQEELQKLMDSLSAL